MKEAADIVISDAVVHFETPAGVVRAVDHVTARFPAGETTGLIGESGCGKSVLGMAVMGLLPAYANISGEILLGGRSAASPAALRELRGRWIGMIPQSPAESLHPFRRIGSQLEEALQLVEPSRKKRRERASALLQAFGFEEPGRVLRAYPFELSGGMQQRVLCALGVCCSPRWVLADEPTKGLDQSLCGQVKDTLQSLRRFGADSMLVITHDLALAEALCHQVAVMYGGEIVERGTDVLGHPLHPYTRAFLHSLPARGMHPMEGLPPAPGQRIAGCKFAPRCPRRLDRCGRERPPDMAVAGGVVRCFLYA